MHRRNARGDAEQRVDCHAVHAAADRDAGPAAWRAIALAFARVLATHCAAGSLTLCQCVRAGARGEARRVTEAAETSAPSLHRPRQRRSHRGKRAFDGDANHGDGASDAQLRELIKSVDFDNNGKDRVRGRADGAQDARERRRFRAQAGSSSTSTKWRSALWWWRRCARCLCTTVQKADGLKLGDVDELVRLADP